MSIQQRKNINNIVNETIEQFGDISVKCKLQNILNQVNINLTELSLITGIRYASLNELKNGKKATLNLQHVVAIMTALRVKSFDDLFELVFEDVAEQNRFNLEATTIYSDGHLPTDVLEKITINKERLAKEKNGLYSY